METEPTPPNVNACWITRALWEQIASSCVDDGKEHGGKALGRLYSDGVAVACAHVPGGPLAKEEPRGFTPDVPFQQACYEGLLGRYPHLRLVVDYHLHVQGSDDLSLTDRRSLLSLLGEDGWGVPGIVVLILTFAAPRQPKATARWAWVEEGALRTKPLTLSIVDDALDRVQRLMMSLPPEPACVVAESILRALATPEEGSSPGGRPLPDVYGRGRLEEGLIQALSLRPEAGMHRVGRIGPIDGPPLEEGECRIHTRPEGVGATLSLDGRALDLKVRRVSIDEGLRARYGALIEEGLLEDACVVFVGLGSLGSALVQLMCQSGIGRFVLMDPDRFEANNLGRHLGDRRDIGRRKTAILKERILGRNPLAKVEVLEEDVLDLPQPQALEDAFAEANLVIVTTDDATANLAANRIAQDVGVPALFVGAFDGGLGGEIVAISGQGPGCYGCVAEFRGRLPPRPRPVGTPDYLALGPGELAPPMDGLAVDLSHLVSIAASQALGILGVEGRGPLKGHPITLVAGGIPRWVFRTAFEVIPCRLTDPGCPICSPDEHRDELPESLGVEI